MKHKVLAKALAKANGGNVEKVREVLERRDRDITRWNYETAFEKDYRRRNDYE
jgi:hypothetical protein